MEGGSKEEEEEKKDQLSRVCFARSGFAEEIPNTGLTFCLQQKEIIEFTFH